LRCNIAAFPDDTESKTMSFSENSVFLLKANLAADWAIGVLDWVNRVVLAPLATCLLLAAAGLMLMEVVTRTAFDFTQSWAEEATRFVLIWAVFLAVCHAYSSGHLVRTELVRQRFSPRMKYITNIINSLLGMFFGYMLMTTAVVQVKHLFFTQMLTIELGAPLWIIKSALIFGGLGIFLFQCKALIISLRGEDPYGSSEEALFND